MKLRIKGNSIRLRLTQTEVDEIGKGKAVRETVPFGNMFPSLHYNMIAHANIERIAVSYEDQQIQVSIPEKQAKQWTSSDTVGIEEILHFDNGDSLHLLIEKDFQCLHKRPHEADESDQFPNPEQSSANN